MTNTLIAYYVVKGNNASLERQYLKIVTDCSIAVSGATATATCVSTMYVHRDEYGPSLNKKAGDCYITIDGVKQNVIASGTKLPDLGDTFLQIGDPVTHTVIYDGTTSKTVSIAAQFDTTDENLKLKNYIIPVEDYTLGTGTIESGSTSLTFPVQVTACTAPTTFTAYPTVFEAGGSVSLAWNGATGGRCNEITGYEIQTATSADGTSWSNWTDWRVIQEHIAEDIPDIERGQYVKYRIRTQGAAGAAYYSGWKESNASQKDNEPYVYISNEGTSPDRHLSYIYDETIDPEQPFGKYMPYVFDGTAWQRHS